MLPKLNDTPKYEVVIPSTKKKIRFRPFLMKEEKILMMALESGDRKVALDAIMDTIRACLEDQTLEVEKLATFDIEYIFLKMRSKSVGETSTIYFKCKECSELNSYTVDLDAIEINVPKKINPLVQLTKTIGVELQFPTYTTIKETNIEGLQQENNMDSILDFICDNIVAVVNDEDRILAKDVSKEELKLFIESTTPAQLRSVIQFFESSPTIKQDIQFICKKCGAENNTTLEGLSDFF